MAARLRPSRRAALFRGPRTESASGFWLLPLAALAALSASAASAASLRPETIRASAAPAGIEGRFVTGLRWTDATGLNLVVLSEIGERPDPASGSGGRRADLRAVRFLERGGVWAPVWTVRDGVGDCDLDITAAFVPSSLAVTDIDRDGLAEVSFLYRLGCMGGMDPTTQKLILYEGTSKYALRGETRQLYREDGGWVSYGGGMTPDAAFREAPDLLRFSRARWAKLGVQRIGQ